MKQFLRTVVGQGFRSMSLLRLVMSVWCVSRASFRACGSKVAVAESGGEGHHAERAGKRRKGEQVPGKAPMFCCAGVLQVRFVSHGGRAGPHGVGQSGACWLHASFHFGPLGQSTSVFPGAGDQRAAPSGALLPCLCATGVCVWGAHVHASFLYFVQGLAPRACTFSVKGFCASLGEKSTYIPRNRAARSPQSFKPPRAT